MSASASEKITLSGYPQIRRLLIQLFSLADLPFDAQELTPRDLKRLFETTRS